jgi:sulfite reductase (NADPH) flavoprotein alpha-component
VLRQILYQVHWCIGITAGVVLAIVGFTGGLLSFEDEIKQALNSDVMRVPVRAETPLPIAQLYGALQTQHPGRRIQSLGLSADAAAAVRFDLALPQPAKPGARRAETRYADPYTGRDLGEAKRGDQFFHVTEDIHRRLAAGNVGKQVVGVATVCLLIMALSGLYLRWPKVVSSWRTWLKPDLRLKGRAFLWQLHAITGTWVLLFYLLAAATGLTWSYPGYRDALFSWSGAPRPTGAGSSGPRVGEVAPAIDGATLGRAWAVFASEVPHFDTATLTLPRAASQPIEIRYLLADAAHDRAFNTMAVNAETAAVERHNRFAERQLAARLVGSLFPLHSGSYFGVSGVVLMMLASLTMPLFAVTGWLLYLNRRARKRLARLAGTTVTGAGEPA